MIRVAAVLVGSVVLAALSGCVTTQHGEGSRAELYETVAQLAEDSSIVVVVTATSHRQGADDPQAMTGIEVSVDQVVAASGLPVDGPDIATSDTLTVWQLGTEASPGPLPFLHDGDRYLLFLVATGLPQLSDGYFVTGSAAGFWVADGSGFSRPVDEGDTLPATITLEDVTAPQTEAPAAS